MATANKRNTKRQDYKKMHEGIELDVEVFDNSIKHEPVITTNTSGGASLEPEDTQMSHNKETHENGDLATSKEEDEEMRLIEQAIEAADAEKQEILKTRKKEELRAQLRRKQLEVKQLKEEDCHKIRKVLIVGDSIVKHLPHIEGDTNLSFRGATIGIL
ncbi:uncharacterized protein LOC123548703 isoform X2 [Mercenaria mercenaria]|uniref:uncharacterized protein LOC123548703 isoform X2 n=1 Tax=Mercenaria mercenaria TaxID=6596 RepID=UPI00234EFD43|nr:uncharacterized protein LOC123548703 isoform X2 [Mercenaria mercenaria]